MNMEDQNLQPQHKRKRSLSPESQLYERAKQAAVKAEHDQRNAIQDAILEFSSDPRISEQSELLRTIDTTIPVVIGLPFPKEKEPQVWTALVQFGEADDAIEWDEKPSRLYLKYMSDVTFGEPGIGMLERPTDKNSMGLGFGGDYDPKFGAYSRYADASSEHWLRILALFPTSQERQQQPVVKKRRFDHALLQSARRAAHAFISTMRESGFELPCDNSEVERVLFAMATEETPTAK
jgi:hypothetical protein